MWPCQPLRCPPPPSTLSLFPSALSPAVTPDARRGWTLVQGGMRTLGLFITVGSQVPEAGLALGLGGSGPKLGCACFLFILF